MPAEGDDLHWDFSVSAKRIHQLGFIHHDDQLAAGAGNDFLVQQRAAETLDEIERAKLDFVCAVDGQVQLRVHRKR